jgi:hypothetical protein
LKLWDALNFVARKGETTPYNFTCMQQNTLLLEAQGGLKEKNPLPKADSDEW